MIMRLNMVGDITLKRGLVSAPESKQWLEDIRQSNKGALREVTIRLKTENGSKAGQGRRLVRARIIKHTSGPMNATGTDVAMEELTLSYERLEME